MPTVPLASRGRKPAKGAKPKPGQQPANGEFEQQHPRGRGGIWMKKGDGMEGDPDKRVQHLQNRLKNLGYELDADGRFGPNTEAALLRFQRDHGVRPDGIVGPRTTVALKNSGGQAKAKAESEAPGAPAPGGKGRYGAAFEGDSAAAQKARGDQNEALTGKRDLAPKPKAKAASKAAAKPASSAGSSRGSRSSTAGGSAAGASNGAILTRGIGMDKRGGDKRVRDMQKLLDDLGFNLGAGGTDGRFGPDTARALRAFQRKYGLNPDGVFGKKARVALNYVAKVSAAREKRQPGVSLEESDSGADGRHGGEGSGDMKRCPSCGWRNAKGTDSCKKCKAKLRKPADDLAESKDTARLASQHAPIGKGGTNWVTKSKPGNKGQLPAYIQNVRNALMRDGHPEGEAHAMAIGVVRKWAAGGGKVGPEVKAAASKAIAEYNAMRAQAKAS